MSRPARNLAAIVAIRTGDFDYIAFSSCRMPAVLVDSPSAAAGAGSITENPSVGLDSTQVLGPDGPLRVERQTTASAVSLAVDLTLVYPFSAGSRPETVGASDS